MLFDLAANTLVRSSSAGEMSEASLVGKFLKKLWCCVTAVGVLQDNLVLSTELTMYVSKRKEIHWLVFSILLRVAGFRFEPILLHYSSWPA